MVRTMGVIVLVVAGVVGAAAVGPLRERLHPAVLGAILAAAGAGLGLGGLLQLHHVGAASWIACPAGLAVLIPVHVRSLFAADGPLRT